MDRKEKGTMFAITGITGNVGGNVARNLLAAGRPVRAVMRDVRKGDGWAQRGCELATADIRRYQGRRDGGAIHADKRPVRTLSPVLRAVLRRATACGVRHSPN